MRFFLWAIVLLLLSSCVSSSKYRKMVAEYEEKLYETDLNYRLASYNAETLRRKLTNTDVRIEVLKDSLSIIDSVVDELKKEIKVLSADSQATAQLIAERRKYQDKYESLQSRFEKLKAVDKKFFPFPTMAGRVELFNNSFDFYVIDLRQTKIRFFLKDEKASVLKSFINLKNFSNRKEYSLEFATNGGMYKPGFEPQGLFVVDGKQLMPIDANEEGYGNFYMQPNGIFLIDKGNRAHVIPTKAYSTFKGKVKHATQSGPALVLNNELNSHFRKGSKNVYVRNGIGTISPNKIVFAISNKPVNFYDFATLFRDYFGCADALYLDGAISKMYLPILNRNQLGGNFGPMIGVWK